MMKKNRMLIVIIVLLLLVLALGLGKAASVLISYQKQQKELEQYKNISVKIHTKENIVDSVLEVENLTDKKTLIELLENLSYQDKTEDMINNGERMYEVIFKDKTYTIDKDKYYVTQGNKEAYLTKEQMQKIMGIEADIVNEIYVIRRGK